MTLRFSFILLLSLALSVIILIWRDVYDVNQSLHRLQEEGQALYRETLSFSDENIDRREVSHKQVDDFFQDVFFLSRSLHVSCRLHRLSKNNNVVQSGHTLEPLLYEIVFSKVQHSLKSQYLLVILDSLLEQKPYQNFVIHGLEISPTQVILKMAIYGQQDKGERS